MKWPNSNTVDEAPDRALAPTPAKIATGVRRPSGLQLAEASCRNLRARYAAAGEKVRALVARRVGNDNNDRPIDRQIVELEREREQLSEQIRPAVALVRSEREPYVARVTKALSPTHEAAAERALVALRSLRVELEVLAQCHEEVSRAGGEADRITVPRLDWLEAQLLHHAQSRPI